jgi:hypothetical protein
MTAIFISHSSVDNAEAEKMKTWLKQQGHQSLFLDFDPEEGIRAGGDWEQILYRRLRQCQAVIILLTPGWLASKWCFAEMVQAREKGKAIFPVKVKKCDADGVLAQIQHVDLIANAEEGYRRLALGLKERDVGIFGWDGTRPPYPGLLALEEDDAAVFFGRTEDVFRGLETLESLRRMGRDAPRFVLLLGASGSGKSSLMRAGLLPRLRRDKANWLPLTPFRPQEDPLAELARALVRGFDEQPDAPSWQDLRDRLLTAAECEPVNGKVLCDLARDALEAADCRNATVLLPIDQAEELINHGNPERANGFLRLLRSALEGSNRELMAIATLRSDFLGAFQTHPVLQDADYAHGFSYEPHTIDALPIQRIADVIEEPARIAGIRLGDGLVSALVRDTGSGDALPLLAFALRRMYDHRQSEDALELRDYETLGGLEGAVREEAQLIFRHARPSEDERQALRAAFVPGMVRVGTQGTYTRRRAFKDELPAGCKRLLGLFVEAHLLVTDQDQDGRETIEVAHEALLRTWTQLSVWLDEDQDNLRLLEGIRRAVRDWEEAGRQEDLLVHRDGRLADAEALVREPRFTLAEGSADKAYLAACLAAQHAREQARRKRIRTTIGGLVAGLVILGLATVWAVIERADAQRKGRDALSRALVAQGQQLFGKKPLLALRLAAEAHALSPSPETESTIKTFAGQGRLVFVAGDVETDRNTGVQPSPDGSVFVVDRINSPGELRRSFDGSIVEVLKDEVANVIFSPEPKGRYFVVNYGKPSHQSIRKMAPGELCRSSDGATIARLRKMVGSAIFSRDSLATYVIVKYTKWGKLFGPELRRSADGEVIKDSPRLAFSTHPASSYFVADNTVYTTRDLQPVVTLPSTVQQVSFSPDPAASYIVARHSVQLFPKSRDRSSRMKKRRFSDLRRSKNGEVVSPLGKEGSVRFSPDPEARYFYIDSGEYVLELRRTSDASVIAKLPAGTLRVFFSPDPEARYFVAQRDDIEAEDDLPWVSELHSSADGRLISRLSGFAAGDNIYFSPDQSAAHLIVGYLQSNPELRRSSDGSLVKQFESPISGAYFAPSGKYFVLNYKASGIYPELRRSSDGKVVELATKRLGRVRFSPNPRATFFIAQYTEALKAPSELRKSSDGSYLATLAGTVESIAFSSDADATFFIIRYEGDKSELWTAHREPRRLLDLGFGLAGQVFDLADQRLVVWYRDGRAYLLDLAWLRAMGGDVQAIPINEVIRLACQDPLASGLLDMSNVEPFLQGRTPQACSGIEGSRAERSQDTLVSPTQALFTGRATQRQVAITVASKIILKSWRLSGTSVIRAALAFGGLM